jgi:undecaprenyl-diphosphatase
MKMKKNNRKNLCIAVALLAAFALWTVAVRYVDVAPIGPRGSTVGFASVNGFVHRLLGVHMSLYTITDWLGLVPVGVGMGFAVLGLVQWIRRKRIASVDYNILVLGGFYIVVMAAYILFETVVVNYRPILMNGYLEASYPSSTTLLVLCVMPTSIMQFHERIKNEILKRLIAMAIIAFMVFMVIGRLVSGVHWLTDIVGGALLSAGLVILYRWVCRVKQP